jgi:hypothetical protein
MFQTKCGAINENNIACFLFVQHDFFMITLVKHKDRSEIHEYVCTQNMSFCFMLDTMSPFSNINF